MTTENNTLSTTKDILSGSVRPLSPLQSVVNEYIFNGHTEHHEDIINSYDESVGYNFSWGQIIEARWAYMEATTISWSFCFGDTLTNYHDTKNHLNALSDISLMAMRSLEVPDYIEYDEGGTVDVFAMRIDGAKEVSARKWLANSFLRKPLHYVFLTCEEYRHIDSDLARAMYLNGVRL